MEAIAQKHSLPGDASWPLWLRHDASDVWRTLVRNTIVMVIRSRDSAKTAGNLLRWLRRTQQALFRDTRRISQALERYRVSPETTGFD